jgi:hypothetical protein
MWDNHLITASFDSLSQRAPDTAANYMHAARREIDSLYGEGYADKNPAIVAVFMQTAAFDFATGAICKILQGLKETSKP